MVTHFLGQYLSVENFLLNTFVKVVGYCTNKHSLCEVTDFGCWNEAVHLCGNRGGLVIAVNGHRLPLLENLSKPFGKRLCSFSYYLP